MLKIIIDSRETNLFNNIIDHNTYSPQYGNIRRLTNS